MSMTINDSTASLQARRSLGSATRALAGTFGRLASGLRIASARDDAAGLAIVSRMSSQIRGMNIAVRNINDGISMMQVADGALNASIDALQRIRELAVQAANSTFSATDRVNLSQEKDQLVAEIQRIAVQTSFNSVGLLNGADNPPYFQQQGGYNGGSRTSYQTTIQVGANAGETLVMAMPIAHVSALGLGHDGSLTSMLTIQGANLLISRIDSALDSVVAIRATLGSVQSRFEAMIANLDHERENVDHARSRIQDADVAVETARLARDGILQQAGVAVLVQANVQPSMALRLLQ